MDADADAGTGTDAAGDADVVDNPDAGRMEIHVGGRRAGFVDYRRHPSLVRLVHTETAPAFQGRGLASMLIRAALESARADGVAVLPTCLFVRSFIRRNPEYLDLVPAQRRAEFDLPADPGR
jgi:predicted GNAT family acetyltransferase